MRAFFKRFGELEYYVFFFFFFLLLLVVAFLVLPFFEVFDPLLLPVGAAAVSVGLLVAPVGGATAFGSGVAEAGVRAGAVPRGSVLN